MKIELHIDRLVVDAGSAGPIDRERLAQAVSQALAQRVDAGASLPPAVQQGPAAGPRLEHRIAAALHQALPAAARGGRP
jgi:hypothetical protein